MKLGGFGNLGSMAAPKARDLKSSSPEKSKAASFEEALGLNKPAAKSVEPKVQDQPKKNLAKDDKPENKPEAKPDAKTSAPAKPEGKQSEAKSLEKPSEIKSEEPKISAQKSPEASQANSVDANSVEANSVEANSVEANGIPSQPSAPSLNGPVQERILNANPDMALNSALLKTPGAKPQQDDGVDSLTRRVVWNDFLRKMKDEFGVDAEDVMKAFATLTDEELAQPPQDTVNSVVAALGLDGSQAQMARKYFNELVDKTKSKSMGEELETSGRQINLTLMSQREMQRKALDRSLDKMNQNFFIKNPQVAKLAAQQMPQQALDQNGQEMMVLGPNGLVPASSLALPLQSMDAAPVPAPQVAPGTPMAALEQMNVKSGKPVEQKNTVDEMVRQFLAPQGKVSAAPMAAAQPAVAAAAVPTAPQAAAVDTLQGLLSNLVGDQTKGDSSDEDSSDFTSDASYLNHTLANPDHLKGAMVKGAEFQGELVKAAAPMPMTVPELVDKAQIMLHEGGGEMKVTMSPEGMGEVAMRVTVNEGKVQVQMITESDEAKRLIERHMGDLKSSLSQNNLHMDTIKIDTATNLGKQLEQQYQDAQRQQAHQTLEQFRQDQQGWRRSFFDVGSTRQYKGQNEGLRDVAAPGDVSAKNRKGNASRRLDLVA